MPSIADQVETLEHDHVAALAQIDALTAANAALASANTTLNAENASLRDQVNDMQQYVDNTRSMAEQIASSTLDMLRASRRPVGGPPAEVVAPKPKVDIVSLSQLPQNENAAAAVQSFMAAGNVDSLGVAPGPSDSIQHDSGDEAKAIAIEEQDASNANALSSQAPETTSCAKCGALSGDDWSQCGIGLCPMGGPTLNDDRRTTSPVNELRSPVLIGPMLVEHSDDKLPIFLTRDTPFGQQQVFG